MFYSTLSSAAVTTLYNSGAGSEASFETRVLADSPRLFWPLQAPSSTTNLPDLGSLPDISGNNDAATPEAGVTPSDAGPFTNDGAIYLDGATDGTSEVETATSNAALPSSFSVAAWFRAPSGLSTGGGIVSFDTAQAGGGSGHDPLVWMDNSGKVVVGTYVFGTEGGHQQRHLQRRQLAPRGGHGQLRRLEAVHRRQPDTPTNELGHLRWPTRRLLADRLRRSSPPGPIRRPATTGPGRSPTSPTSHRL